MAAGWKIEPNTNVTTSTTSTGDYEVTFGDRTGLSATAYTITYTDKDGKCGKFTVNQKGGGTPPGGDCDTSITIGLVIHNNSSSELTNITGIRFIIESPDTNGRYNVQKCDYNSYLRLPEDPQSLSTSNISPGGSYRIDSFTPKWGQTLYKNMVVACQETSNGGLRYRKVAYRPVVEEMCATTAGDTGYLYPFQVGVCQDPEYPDKYVFKAQTQDGADILDSQCYGAMLYHDGNISYQRCLLLNAESSNPSKPASDFEFENGKTYHLYIFDGPNPSTGEPGHDITKS